MVKVKKGSMTLSIPAGSVKKYKAAGWELANEGKGYSPADSEGLIPVVDPDGAEIYELEDEEDVEYVDPEELAQKPLSELDKDELKILADFRGIDTSELTSAKQLRAALRAME